MDLISVTHNEARELGAYGRQEVALYSLGAAGCGWASNLLLTSLTLEDALVNQMKPWQQAMLYAGPWLLIVGGCAAFIVAWVAGRERRRTIEQIELEMGAPRERSIWAAFRGLVVRRLDGR